MVCVPIAIHTRWTVADLMGMTLCLRESLALLGVV